MKRPAAYPVQSLRHAAHPTLRRPHNLFLHDLVLDACRRHRRKTALVDSSCGRRLTYAEYGELCRTVARGLIAAGKQTRRRRRHLSSQLAGNSASSYHAATLVGAIPTLLNPTYREREVRYQLENSGAAILITDGRILDDDQPRWPAQLPPHHRTRQARTARSRSANLLTSSAPFARSPSKPRTNPRRASLLQRHHRIAQGSHALPLQPRRQRLSDPRSRRDRLHPADTISVFCRSTTSMD